MSVDKSPSVADSPSVGNRLNKVSASLQSLALTAMLGLVAWLTFAQTRALQDARRLVAESRAAADRADRICRQSAMITIAVRELREEFVRQRQEQQPQDGSFAMNDLLEEND